MLTNTQNFVRPLLGASAASQGPSHSENISFNEDVGEYPELAQLDWDMGPDKHIEQEKQVLLQYMTMFLVRHCDIDVLAILLESDTEKHYPLVIDMSLLYRHARPIAERLLYSDEADNVIHTSLHTRALLEHLEMAAQFAQNQIMPAPELQQTPMSVKRFVHLRFTRLPPVAQLKNRLPRADEAGRLVVVSGTVTRTGEFRVHERVRMYKCSECGGTFRVEANPCLAGQYAKPTQCLVKQQTEEKRKRQRLAQPNMTLSEDEASECSPRAKFTVIQLPLTDLTELCQSYQEIKLQEPVNKLDMRTTPRSILVLLKDELVDQCKPGDDVSMTGVPLLRWRSNNLQVGQRPECEVVFIANHVRVHNENRSRVQVTEALMVQYRTFWQQHRSQPMRARQRLTSSVAPHIYGMDAVKLAVLLVLLGGVAHEDSHGTRTRGEAHMLLVGDPGTAKSQLLKFAAQIVPRSVSTTGIGTTTAGLTVAAVKDSGEWQLEAGALVLADRGVCCIDEFSGIREHDRTAIHEAMEQQTLSVAKAGLVCKLNTRCSILAATNPKGRFDTNSNISVNIGVASPLLSRFDLVLVLLDRRDTDWDRSVSSFVIRQHLAPDHGSTVTQATQSRTDETWSCHMLQGYISHVKHYLRPFLTAASTRVLRAYYQLQRQSDTRNAARTTIRMLESLIRLSQAHAKLMYRDRVLVQDAVSVILLMEASLESRVLLRVMPAALQTHVPDDPDRDFSEKSTAIIEHLGLAGIEDAPEDLILLEQQKYEQIEDDDDEFFLDDAEITRLTAVVPSSHKKPSQIAPSISTSPIFAPLPVMEQRLSQQSFEPTNNEPIERATISNDARTSTSIIPATGSIDSLEIDDNFEEDENLFAASWQPTQL